MEFNDTLEYETDSDEQDVDEDLEHELYSVLHYNILSNEIPSHILDKYDIKRNGKNEYLISFKKSKEKHELVEDNLTSTENNIAKDTGVNIGSTQNVIQISDTDSDDVILTEKPLDVTYVSSPSVVICSSSSASDMEDTVILNIDKTRQLSNIFPFDDSEEEPVEVKWKDVISPSSWTKNMKKFYNKPCEELKKFDYRKIQEEIKGNGDWHIHPADRFPCNMKPKRCHICRQTGHQRKDCPRRFSNCCMCGNPGHNDSRCPFKKCLNCGKKNQIFVAMCQRCERVRYQTCSECQQTGHSKYHCPDTWRRFHSTTNGKLTVKEESVNENLMCCNCAQSGHLFEDCPKLYWSVYPPTSYLVKKKEEAVRNVPRGKRSRSLGGDSIDFDRTPKMPKWNPSMRYNVFSRASTSFEQQSPVRTPKINKRKRYFQNNFFNNVENLSNSPYKNVNIANDNSITPSKHKKRKKKKTNISNPNKTI